ncbi:uncharacterized protein LOC121375992 [Gigantopelta aegis]|uniref:uncharacterized protein LOC121375992 n=1 Tax=Gigantopelta aegis TaxID=1735272 RepID=UPI001B88CD15|nr:uncharacterized protein LOC121375992 [Gigantopelta aegis]
MCLEIYEVTSNLFYYYYSTESLAQANNVNVKIVPNATAVTVWTDICDDLVHDPGAYSVLLRNGTNIAEEAVLCPTVFQSYMQYQFTDASNNVLCTQSSYLDVCTNKDMLAFNYSDCSATVLYSSSGSLYCLFYKEVSSSSYYITLYNTDSTVDDSSTFRLACLLLESGGGVSYATQYPNECQNTTYMNSTYVSSPGGTFVFTSNSTCPVTPPDAAIPYDIIFGVLGTVLFLLLLAGGLVLLLRLLKKKKTRNGVSPTQDPAAVAIANKPDINSRTLFTPVPKDSLKINGIRKLHPSAVTSLIDTDNEKMLSPSSVAVAMNVPPVAQRPPPTPGSLLATSDPDVEVSISEYSDSTETSSPTRMSPTIAGPTPGFTTTTAGSVTASSMTLDSFRSQPLNTF